MLLLQVWWALLFKRRSCINVKDEPKDTFEKIYGIGIDQQAIHEGKKYTCRECEYQATTHGGLAQHQRAIHEGKKCPCEECDYQATTKGSLAQHQCSVHEGKKYPCRECDHQATSKSDLNKHQHAIHEGKKYPCRECDYQSTTEVSLAQHQRSVHIQTDPCWLPWCNSCLGWWTTMSGTRNKEISTVFCRTNWSLLTSLM